MISEMLLGAYNQSPLGQMTAATGYTPANIGTTLKDVGSSAGSIGLVKC